MTSIDPSGHVTGTPNSSIPEENYIKDPQGNIVGYRIGKYVILPPEGVTGEAARAYIENTLEYISALTNTPIDDITELTLQDPDLKLRTNFDAPSDTPRGHTITFPGNSGVFYGLRLNTTGQTSLNTYNNSEYFGNDIPYFPKGSEAYLDLLDDSGNLSPYLSSLSGASLGIALGGIAGTAQTLYNTNYPAGSNPTPLINPDPQTLQLLQKMFGPTPPGGFTLGHLNVLKMMGLVKGNAGASPDTWQLTANGISLLGKFNTNTANSFVPQMSLLEPGIETEGNKANALFLSAGGYVQGKFASDVEALASTIHNKLETDGEPTFTLPAIPEGNPPVLSPTEMLNALFKKPYGNTAFTASEINTAISMGLITYDPTQPPDKAYTLTTNGQTYLNSKRAAAFPTNPTTTGPNQPGNPQKTPEQLYAERLASEVGTGTTGGGDSYGNPEALAARGLPLWVAQWIFKHYAVNGKVNETVLNQLVSMEIITHPQSDGSGDDGDQYGITTKGMNLALAAPEYANNAPPASPKFASNAEFRRYLYIESQLYMEYAGIWEGMDEGSRPDFAEGALAHSRDPQQINDVKASSDYRAWCAAQVPPLTP